ncbi:MAG TPA: hypothetical protein VFE36_11230 [Candidatus Baltobacteraceae bacterium]|nr:hypothetical protein [Candidatus Baltobacteraceae bacterium]
MLHLSSTSALIAAIQHARNVAVRAYTIHGSVLKALESAARRGAHVEVRLDEAPFADEKDHLAGENRRLVGEMRAAGIDAGLDHPLHSKAIDVDGTLYLDEKNWDGEADIVVRDDDPGDSSVATTKSNALEQEGALLCDADADAIVETETFGRFNPVSAALDRLARDGKSPRLLVSARDLRHNARELAALQKLSADGVRVRVCADSAKFAVAGGRAWLGSANATVAHAKFDMPDWGACTSDAQIVTAVRDRLEARWASARAFAIPQESSL